MQQQKLLLEETIKLQQIASDPTNSVFVSASAGSGKTKVLTDRVLRLLLSGVKPGKILCLTYTKVAASEMQNRILNELASWVYLETEKLEEKLLAIEGIRPGAAKIKQARTIFAQILDDSDGLKIGTIHSFCQSLIKQFPIESKINPNFEIIDETTARNFLNEARKELLRLALDQQDLASRIEAVSAQLNENSFFEIIQKLIDKKERLLALKEEFFDEETIEQKIYQLLGCDIKQSEEKILEEFYQNLDRKTLLEFCEITKTGTLSTDQKHGKLIASYLNNAQNFNSYLEVFVTDSGTARKDLVTKKIALTNPEILEFLLARQQEILELSNFLNSLKTAKASSNLLFIAYKMLEIYDHLKQKSGLVDYNDLISITSKLLQNSRNSDWIKYKLDGFFDHILIDESQDTNHYQWNIIKAITEDFFAGIGASNKERTIFVVGDEKQSIFRFQGSDPEIFSDIYFYYQKKLEDVKSKLEDVKLNNSFRSLKSILQAVDLVFSLDIYQKAISKLKAVNHSEIRDSHLGKVEIWPIFPVIKKEKADASDVSWKLNFEESNEYKAKDLLAKEIVTTIKNWISQGRILKSHNRQIRYGDIMILLKNRTNDLGNLIIKYCREAEIPVSGNDRIQLIKHIIVQDFLALAKFILLKNDDLNLACLLKSPIIGINEDELLQLCLLKNEKNISLLKALESSKLRQEYDLLKDFLKQKNLSVYELFSYVLENKNINEKILKHFGSAAFEIVNQFLNLCLKHEGSLQSFVADLENLELEIKIENNNLEADEIRITTIHSSKGLEAPIVFLSDCAHSNNGIYGQSERISWYKNFPLWNVAGNNWLIEEVKKSEREVIKEEYLRLLYVAMTRAADELYICGFGDNIANDCWYNIIYESLKNSASLHNFSFGQGLILGDLQEEFLKKENQKDLVKPIIPAFLKEPAKLENTREIIYPSKPEDYKNFQFQGENKINLGKAIHQILEFALNFAKDFSKDNEEKIKKFANRLELNQELENQALNQVFTLLKNSNFREILKQDIKTEVPIIGEINGKIISGKIDLLVFSQDPITIYDYKSNSTDVIDEELIAKYKTQLTFYQQILQKIYPDKKINCALIWTYSSKIEFI